MLLRACLSKRSRRIPRCVLITLVLCACSSFPACDSTITRKTEGIILQLNGSGGIVTERDGRTQRQLAKDSHINAGETIATREEGRVALTLLPGALVHLEPASLFYIGKLVLGKNGFATAEAMHRSLLVRLGQGALFCVVQFETDPPDWILETPHGRLLSGPGGLCRVEAGSGKTRVIAVRGGFSFEPADGTARVRLEPGYVYDWPSSLRAPFPGELDLESLPQIEEAQNVERKLLELQRQLRLQPFPWREP